MSGGQQKSSSGRNAQAKPRVTSADTSDTNWSQAVVSHVQQSNYNTASTYQNVAYSIDASQAGTADSSAVYAGQQYYPYPVYSYYQTEGASVYPIPQSEYEDAYQIQTYNQPPVVSVSQTTNFETTAASSGYTGLPSGTTTGGGKRGSGKSSGALFDNSAASYTADWVTQTTQILSEMTEIPDGNDPASANYSPSAWAESTQLQVSPTGESASQVGDLTQQLGNLKVSSFGAQSVYNPGSFGRGQSQKASGYHAASTNLAASTQRGGNDNNQRPWKSETKTPQQANRRSNVGNASGNSFVQNQGRNNQQRFGNPSSTFTPPNRQNLSSLATGSNAVNRVQGPRNTGQRQQLGGGWRPPTNIRNAPSPTMHYSPPNQPVMDTSSSNTTSGPRTPRQRSSYGASQWSPPNMNNSNFSQQSYQVQVPPTQRPQQQHQYQQRYNQRSNYQTQHRYQRLPSDFNPNVPPPFVSNPRQPQIAPYYPGRPTMPPPPYNQMPMMPFRPTAQQMRAFMPAAQMPYGVPPYFPYGNNPYAQARFGGPPMGPPFMPPQPPPFMGYNNGQQGSRARPPFAPSGPYRGRKPFIGPIAMRQSSYRNVSPKQGPKPPTTLTKTDSTAATIAESDPQATNTESSSLAGDLARPLDTEMARSVNRGPDFDRDETTTPAPVGDVAASKGTNSNEKRI